MDGREEGWLTLVVQWKETVGWSRRDEGGEGISVRGGCYVVVSEEGRNL